MRRIGVLTSGGDAPGMNAAVRAIVRGGVYNGLKVFGIQRGFEGLIHGEIKEMDVSSVADLIHRGGTVLRSARSKDFMTKEGQQKALDQIRAFGLDGIAIIGGDGSLKGGLCLAEAGIPVMGLPGTIDNDLGYTDFTIGFDTAVNTVLDAIGKIRDTSTSHDRCTVVEVMGRHCGDIAYYAGVAGGAEYILTSETEEDLNALCRKVIDGQKRGKLHSIIVRAEGCKISTAEVIKLLEQKTGMETRAVVLGYVQRGGSPSAQDRILASRMGYRAVELFLDNKRNRAVGVRGMDLIDLDLEEALKIQRKTNTELIKLADILSI